MKIGLTPEGKYSISEGSSVLCQCPTLTEASAVMLYLANSPITTMERETARNAILDWDNQVKAKREKAATRRANQKAHKQQNLSQKEDIAVTPEEGIIVPDLPEV